MLMFGTTAATADGLAHWLFLMFPSVSNQSQAKPPPEANNTNTSKPVRNKGCLMVWPSAR
jgi:hypothetical protein